VFDGGSQVADSAWRSRFLSAGMAYFRGSAQRPGSVVEATLELLKA
jgi:hypothetical protein